MLQGTDYLQELARQVRRRTIDVLDAAHEEWLTWAPPGTSNHILWHAGHALWLQDVLTVRDLAGVEDLPPDWAETFGMDCRPVQQTAAWPTKRDLLERLSSQLERTVALYAATPNEKFSEPIAAPAGSATAARPLAARMVHGWHDEAVHQGEMYLLLKICRARR